MLKKSKSKLKKQIMIPVSKLIFDMDWFLEREEEMGMWKQSKSCSDFISSCSVSINWRMDPLGFLQKDIIKLQITNKYHLGIINSNQQNKWYNIVVIYFYTLYIK